MQPITTTQKAHLIANLFFTFPFQPFKSHLGLCFSLQQEASGKQCVEIVCSLPGGLMCHLGTERIIFK